MSAVKRALQTERAQETAKRKKAQAQRSTISESNAKAMLDA